MGDGLVVGVDLGSSSARAVAVSPDGAVRGSVSARYQDAKTWPPGRADPRAWLQAVAAALQALRVRVPAAARPDALCLGGQSPTTVPLVDPDHEPELGAGGLAVTCRHPAGATESADGQHLRQLDLLRGEGGDVEPAQAWDWLVVQFGGPRRQARWPGDAELPGYGPLVRTGDVVAVADGTGGLSPGTPLVAGAQDAYLAFWAAGTDVPGRALDPGGRTGGLGVAVPAGSRPPGMFGFSSAAPGVDIVGGPVNGHGLMLEWLEAVTGRPVEELLDLAGRVPPGAAGVMALPYLEGERAPRWNRALRAELVGLGSDTGPGELARAVLEGTAYGLAHIAADLARSGVAAGVLVCGGSPGRSRLWCEIKASVLGVPVEMPRYADLAAYGAALAAGAGAGWWPKPGHGASGSWPRPAVDVVEPSTDAACQSLYRAGYQRFVELGDAAVARLDRRTP